MAHVPCVILGGFSFDLGIRCATLMGTLIHAVLKRPTVSQLEELLGPDPDADYLAVAKVIAINQRRNAVLRTLTRLWGIDWLSRHLSCESAEHIVRAVEDESATVLAVGMHIGVQYGHVAGLTKLGLAHTVMHEPVSSILAPRGLRFLPAGRDSRENAKSLRELTRRMRNGEVGIVLVDGNRGAISCEACLFGQKFNVALGAGFLQGVTGACVVPVTCEWEGEPPRPVTRFYAPIYSAGEKPEREQVVKDICTWGEAQMRSRPAIIRGHRIPGYLHKPKSESAPESSET